MCMPHPSNAFIVYINQIQSFHFHEITFVLIAFFSCFVWFIFISITERVCLFYFIFFERGEKTIPGIKVLPQIEHTQKFIDFEKEREKWVRNVLCAKDEISILSIVQHIYKYTSCYYWEVAVKWVRAVAHSQHDAWKINVYIIQKRCENKGSNVKTLVVAVTQRCYERGAKRGEGKIEENQEIESTRPMKKVQHDKKCK